MPDLDVPDLEDPNDVLPANYSYENDHNENESDMELAFRIQREEEELAMMLERQEMMGYMGQGSHSGNEFGGAMPQHSNNIIDRSDLEAALRASMEATNGGGMTGNGFGGTRSSAAPTNDFPSDPKLLEAKIAQHC